MTYEVAVIGAGVFGSWIAWRLGQAGKSVMLVDAWGPGHSRSSSGGESRIIRMGYGADEIYTRMAIRSLALWQDLFRKTGQVMFHRTGVLWMARDGDPYSEATRSTLEKVGVPNRETGRHELTVEAFHSGGEEPINEKNSYASPTPLLSGDRVYLHFGPNGTACIRNSGEIVWRTRLKYSSQHGRAVPPCCLKIY